MRDILLERGPGVGSHAVGDLVYLVAEAKPANLGKHQPLTAAAGLALLGE